MRIKTIADLIGPAQIVIDVGSDHALLAIELLKQQKAQKVINIDINPNPLNTGINNLKKSNLLSKTDNFLNDGLKNLKLTDPIDYCVISGLGGKKIIEIISNHNLMIEYFLLVPNNNATLIRQWAYQNNYKIFYETILSENKHFYELIILNKKIGVKVHNNFKDLTFGKNNLKLPNQNFVLMWTQKYDHIIKHNLDKKNAMLKKMAKIIKRKIINMNHYERSIS